MSVKTSQVYIDWIIAALDKNPQKLSRSGLARHLGLDRSLITRLLAGERNIKIDELSAIAEYLGEPLPVAGAPLVGRIGAAWFEIDASDDGSGSRAYAPVIDAPYTGTPQIAFVLEIAAPPLSLRAGDVLIAVALKASAPPPRPSLVVVRKHRSGLQALALAEIDRSGAVTVRTGGDGDKAPTPVALVIEIRRRL